MLDLEIRERLEGYLDGEITRSAFEDWFYSATWDVESEDGTARELTFAIMRLLAERSNGDWNETELKERLRPMLTTYWLDLVDESVRTGSTGLTETSGREIAAAAGRAPASASV